MLLMVRRGLDFAVVSGHLDLEVSLGLLDRVFGMRDLEVELGRMEVSAGLGLADVALGSIDPDLVIRDADGRGVEGQLWSVDLHLGLAHAESDLSSSRMKVASVRARREVGTVELQVGLGTCGLEGTLRLVSVEIDVRLLVLEGPVLVVGAGGGRERGVAALADSGPVARDSGVDS